MGAILAALLIPAAAPAAQQPPEEKVVVTASAYPVPFENLSRTVAVFTREDISRLPARSLMDVLAYIASMDTRSRAPLGLQSDMSVRGAAFSQVLILVDGVRINDSQTGHHNSDFPVQLQDVERIEVLLGAGSSIYGADAFGGIVNIITRRRAAPARGSISAGQFGLADGSFSVGFQKGKIEESVSATANRSSGFQYDRDFRSIAVSSQTRIGDRSDFYVSHVNKEFGANNFYGPSPSKEWTNQTFLSVDHGFGEPSSKAVFQSYYRTHGDRFLYDIRTPSLFESRHRTHAVSALVKAQHALSDTALLTAGGEVGGDWISSNTLGRHAFARTSLFSEIQWTPGKTVAIYPGFRLDYYSNFGPAASPSLSGSWWMLPRIRLRSSVGRAFRIPTFTELYYRDPNNEANSSLKPETAWSAEAGADFIPAGNWLGSITYFSRHARNVIDWIRQSESEKWRSSNIRKLRTEGAELNLERFWGSRGGLEARYSYISSDAGWVDYISKYVLDYARHSWTASGWISLPFAFEYKQGLNYRRRSNGQSYWLLDGRLERHFHRFAAALDFTNLLNSRYQEIAGVDMPGRWFVLSLSTR